MPTREVWDVERRKNVWAVQRAGTEPPESVHTFKESAISRALVLARSTRGQLRIKGEDGQIQEQRNYGEDALSHWKSDGRFRGEAAPAQPAAPGGAPSGDLIAGVS